MSVHTPSNAPPYPGYGYYFRLLPPPPAAPRDWLWYALDNQAARKRLDEARRRL